MLQLLRKIVWQFLNKLNIELPYHSGILLLAIYPKELKTGAQTKACMRMFIAALFTIAKG